MARITVTRQNFLVWAASQNAYATIKDIADGKHDADALGQLRSSALTLIAFMIAGGQEVLDLGIPSVSALFDAWKTLGAINQAQYDALVAMAETSASLDVADGVSVVLKGVIPGLGIGEVYTRSGDKFIGPGTHWASAAYVIAHPELFGLA